MIDLKDGFSFQEVKVNKLSHPHMGYPGAEVSTIAYFGKTRFKVAIDIGFGDIVNPVEYEIPLTTSSKGVLFEKNVKLPCYPKEFIFAEKLETIIHRGSINSRMKDFHDLYSMISSEQLQLFHNLRGIIKLVFEHRETPFSLPIIYDENEVNQLQNFWREYLKNLRAENADNLPKRIAQVITKINERLKETADQENEKIVVVESLLDALPK